MNSTVANEVVDKPVTKSLLETWGKNERMRHVPSIEWMVHKLDVDVRRRIDILFAPFAVLPSSDSRFQGAESEFRTLCRAIDRLAEPARHTRGNNVPSELRLRIDWAITHAVTSLNNLDPNLFGRRYPFQTLERSKGEPLYAALLVVIERVRRLTNTIRAIDGRIDEHLLEGLVTLQEPLREQAIA
jgi:hypothetical protein